MAYDKGGLVKIGSLWPPKPGGKSQGTGYIYLMGLKVRVVLVNNKFAKNANDPPLNIMSAGLADAPQGNSGTAPEQQASSGIFGGAQQSAQGGEASFPHVPGPGDANQTWEE